MDLREKNILIVGTGISGISAARLVARVSEGRAEIIFFDSNKKLSMADVRKKLPDGIGAEIYTGILPEEVAGRTDLVILSPGVPVDSEWIQALRDRGIPVWGEVELAYRFAKGRLIAITGTNGKTTTTALTGQIMQDYMGEAFVVGNIGIPYTDIVCDTTEKSVTVAEISSFQLETTYDFTPDVSAILNITPDHLARHHTMENYVAIKKSIVKNQKKDSRCILNYDDTYTRAFGTSIPARPFYFSSSGKLENGIYLEEDAIWLADGNEPVKVMHIQEMKLLGRHNVENVMAAIAMTYSMGVPLKNIVDTVKEFKAVEHRIEYVATKRGVDYYNDSKGTNPDAAIKGIQAMNRPTILIGGGYDKDSEYDEWIRAFDGKVKWLVLLGQTRDKIAQCARKYGFYNILMVDSLEEAVEICAAKAVEGDAVLLSPACASWGMFPNYEVRGTLFKQYVANLEE